MAWMPGAIRKEISRHNRRRTSQRNRINYHVAVSEASSLAGYFSGAAVCSHFYVRRDGTIEQYIDTDFYSAADGEGNDATISVETQGGVRNADAEPWTEAQIAALGRIAAWVSTTHPSIPLTLAKDSKRGASSKGLSWHRLGIDPWRVLGGMRYSWSRGKLCPGKGKIAQMPAVRASALLAKGQPISHTPPVGNGGGVRNWLQQGDTGERVKNLQRLLNLRGYKLAVDGSFGPATLAAVRSFQSQARLVVDGFAGPATMAALTAAPEPISPSKYLGVGGRNYLRQGDRGEPVKALQRLLNDRGYRLAVDGSFGPATERAVRAFQRANRLTVDGSAGPQTQDALRKVMAPVKVTAPVATTVLRRGMTGQAVRDLQRHLNRHYPAYSRLVVDGSFGPAVEAVVKEFQRRSRLQVDGIVGPATRKALGL